MFEEFEDGPEAGEAEHAKKDGGIDILNEQRANAAGYAKEEEHRPALYAEVVFTLDDNRMEKPDAQESRQAEYDAVVVHYVHFGTL